MKKQFLFTCMAGLALFLSADSAEAYFTSKQSAVKLTPTTALYTITYSFGLPKNDLYLPAATTRGVMHGESDTKLGYTVREKDGAVVKTGDTAAIVFSNAKLKDGMYFVPKGKSATFTFTAFFRTDSKTIDEEFKVQVEQLPFPTKVNENTQVRSLNPSELTYYVTPTVTLE